MRTLRLSAPRPPHHLPLQARLDHLLAAVTTLEHLCGDSLSHLQWRHVVEVAMNFSAWPERFGECVPAQDLLAMVAAVENTLLEPPCVSWLNRQQLLGREHTEDVDTRYFKL
jgi:hypothetical protein